MLWHIIQKGLLACWLFRWRIGGGRGCNFHTVGDTGERGEPFVFPQLVDDDDEDELPERCGGDMRSLAHAT